MYKGIECKIYPNQQQADIIQMTFTIQDLFGIKC